MVTSLFAELLDVRCVDGLLLGLERDVVGLALEHAVVHHDDGPQVAADQAGMCCELAMLELSTSEWPLGYSAIRWKVSGTSRSSLNM